MGGDNRPRMGERRVVKLGVLTVTGERFLFEAHQASFAAVPGEEIEVGVEIDYREASHLRETCRIEYAAEIGGVKLGSTETSIHDRPVVRDDVIGFISRVHRVSGVGSHAGRFVLDAFYGTRHWVDGRPSQNATFRKEGAFTLEVS